MLKTIFPHMELISPSDFSIPDSWNDLLVGSLEHSLQQLEEMLGLVEGSESSDLLRSTKSMGLLIPRKKRLRKKKKGRLAIELPNGHVFYFEWPNSHGLELYPDSFQNVLKNVGRIVFSQSGGEMLTGASLHQTSEMIRSTMLEAQVMPPEEILTFYSHRTGDYSCWLDGDFSEIFYYDHELNELEHCCGGDFSSWFSYELLQWQSIYRDDTPTTEIPNEVPDLSYLQNPRIEEMRQVFAPPGDTILKEFKERELRDVEESLLKAQLQLGVRLVLVGNSYPPGQKCNSAIVEHIDSLRKGGMLDKTTGWKTAEYLGFFWAHQVRAVSRWHWRYLWTPSYNGLGFFSPDRSRVCFPVRDIFNILTKRRRQNTLPESFDRMRSERSQAQSNDLEVVEV